MPGDISALSSRDTQAALPSGATLKKNRYVVGKAIAQGSFGITYRAWDASLKAEVAIKEYLPWDCSAFRDRNGKLQQRSSDGGFKRGLESFLKQVRVLAKFDLPNVARIYDFFKANGTAYMVMSYVSGENLDAYLESRPRPQEKKVLEIVFPLLECLGMLHMESILHRDIKPSNIAMRPNGGPCLLDLGTAREVLSIQQQSSYSSDYSPPERFDKHAKQGPWTDVYALGAVCYRIIAGQQPQSALTRLKAVRSLQPDPLQPAQEVGRGNYRPGFLRAIDYALDLDPTQRPQNTWEWREIMVPTGVEPRMIDRKNGSLLGKLRHLFRPSEQLASRLTRESDSGPTMEAITYSAAVNQATEPHSALQDEEEDTKPAVGIDYLSVEPVEPRSLTEAIRSSQEDERVSVSAHVKHTEDSSSLEDGRTPSVAGSAAAQAQIDLIGTRSSPEDKILNKSDSIEMAGGSFLPEDAGLNLEIQGTAASANSELAKPISQQEAVGPTSTVDNRIQPGSDKSHRSAANEPAAATPITRSIEPSAIPQVSALRHEAKPPLEIPSGVDTLDMEMAPTAKTEGGFDKLFETSRQPSTKRSVGIAEPLLPLETPAHEKEWSNLFDLHERARTTADVYTAKETRLGNSQVKPPASVTKAPVEAAISAIAAHNERARKLFRNHDYAGALDELEVAKTLEPENPMTLANIKRIQQHLQGQNRPIGNPWATS